MGYDKKEIIDTVCVDNVLYNIVQYSLDGEIIKEQAELEGSECDGTSYEKWVVNTGKTICVDDIPYYVEEKWVSNDNVKFYIISPPVERASSTEAPNSNICNVVGEIGNTLYRWVYTNDSYCLPSTDVEGVNYNCETTSAVTYVEGDSSTYMCYMNNKYKVIAKLISTLCDGEYRVYGYEQGDLIEENSVDCGYFEQEKCEIETKVQGKYDVIYDGAAVEWDEYAIPTVSGTITTTKTNEDCTNTVTTESGIITDYTITYSPSGVNTTNDNRDVIATVSYNGEKIGEFMYIQKLNPNSTSGDTGTTTEV